MAVAKITIAAKVRAKDSLIFLMLSIKAEAYCQAANKTLKMKIKLNYRR